MKIKLMGYEFEIKARFQETVKGFPNDDKDTMYHNKFIVSVKLDGKTRRFNFFGSMADYQKGTTELSDQDLEYALDCFLSDGSYALDSFSGFCSELGYDEDSRNTERIYKACKKTLDKILDLGILESEISDLINALHEREDINI